MAQISTLQSAVKVFWTGLILEGLPEGTTFTVPEDDGAWIVYLRTGNCITYWNLLTMADALRVEDSTLVEQINKGARKLRELHLLGAVYNIFPGWRV